MNQLNPYYAQKKLTQKMKPKNVMNPLNHYCALKKLTQKMKPKM